MNNEIEPAKPAIVLDLDETLVYSSSIKVNCDSFPVRIGRRMMHVQFRPGLSDFIKEIKDMYDIYFFTASNEQYANQIIEKIAPETPNDRRFFRQDCRCMGGYPVKNLEIINRPLNKVLLVDDLVGSALLNLNNLVHISPWNGSKEDHVLMSQLLPVLRSFHDENDLPKAFQKTMETKKYKDLSSPKV